MPAAPEYADHVRTSQRTAIDYAIADFEEETRNAASVQQTVLTKILGRNADTEYLRERCRLEGLTDAVSFRERVPIVTHSDLKSYFDRIADGDKAPLLMAEPITTLSLSSGTTSDGQQKYLVLYKEILEASGFVGTISAAYTSRDFPTRSGGMCLELVFSGRLSTTTGGLALGTATTHLFGSEEFKQKQKFTGIRACTPDEVVRHSDNKQAMYCHLLSALLCREEIEFITATFAYTIVEAFSTFELELQNLCKDILSGELASQITDPSLREAMSKLMPGPNPELANTIASKCSALEGWAGVIPQIWPNCKYLYSIMTGSMEPYLGRLSHYAGALPLVSAGYGATESWIGVNVCPKAEPHDVIFTVVPSFAYFEFLPIPPRDTSPIETRKDDVHTGGEVSSPVGLTEVELYQEYEILLTTYGGLYRYRLGDIVRVVGFLNASPQLAYVCRKDVLLSVNTDKTTEKDLQIAVKKAMDQLKCHYARAELVDFTSCVNFSSTPGHYVVFWELNQRSNGEVAPQDAGMHDHLVREESVLRDCATAMDLAFMDPGYMGNRQWNRIGPLKLCLMNPGTFRKLLDRYLDRGTGSIAQYKTPRCVTSSEMLIFLESHIVCSVCSLG